VTLQIPRSKSSVSHTGARVTPSALFCRVEDSSLSKASGSLERLLVAWQQILRFGLLPGRIGCRASERNPELRGNLYQRCQKRLPEASTLPELVLGSNS